MSSLRHRSIKHLAHGYSANKWKSWDLNAGGQAIDSTCCTQFISPLCDWKEGLLYSMIPQALVDVSVPGWIWSLPLRCLRVMREVDSR